MTIVFIHPHQAFLPEIDAYIDFFSNYGIQTETAYPAKSWKIKADVEWHFMGTNFARRKTNRIIIHEYASASLPWLRNIKDRVKAIFNARPDYRLFLNEYVRRQFQFGDNIPYGFRDMGLPAWLINKDVVNPNEKQYDFIYSGSVSKDRKMEKLFSAFSRPPLNNQTLLILSRDYSSLANQYSSSPNILFHGPVKPSEVPGYILRSKFCINYRPLTEPHSHQTPAKLLEYAACKTPILTSDFYWIREFCKKYGGSFFVLKSDLSNLTWENVCHFSYSFPDLGNWTWENQIRKSGILEFLQSRFPQLDF